MRKGRPTWLFAALAPPTCGGHLDVPGPLWSGALRIRAVEHRLYPRIVDAFGRGELRVDGRHVRLAGTDVATEAVR